MIELRFQHDLYDAAALDEALAVYGPYGTVDLAREADGSVVRVTVGADAASQGIDERTLAAELGNYALGKTIESARARPSGPDAAIEKARAEAAK